MGTTPSKPDPIDAISQDGKMLLWNKTGKKIVVLVTFDQAVVVKARNNKVRSSEASVNVNGGADKKGWNAGAGISAKNHREDESDYVYAIKAGMKVLTSVSNIGNVDGNSTNCTQIGLLSFGQQGFMTVFVDGKIQMGPNVPVKGGNTWDFDANGDVRSREYLPGRANARYGCWNNPDWEDQLELVDKIPSGFNVPDLQGF